MIDIIIFSDSVGTGQYTSLTHSWAALLSEYLSQFSESLEEDIIVTNSSGNGRTTRQALEIMQYEVLSKTPDILIIQFGLNDCNIWADAHGVPRVTEAAFMANLAEMAWRAKVADTPEIFLVTNHPSCMQDLGYNRRNNMYNCRIREVYRDSEVHLLDMEKVFEAKCCSDCLLKDGLHLNNKGHILYFNAIHPIIKKAILRI